jgi:hypothetical protein
MCLSKVYYNTYSDGAHDVTEKKYPCRDGRSCSRPDVRKYDRKLPFTKLDDAEPESYRSLSERKPTPYLSGGSKSPSPSRRRDSGVYMSGANPSSKHYDYRDPYGAGYDPYGSYSRHDPRDRHDRERERDRGREPRLKRSSTAPHIVYMDRDGKPSTSRSRSNSHSSSRDIPLGLVPLADEYGRRHSHRERDRDRDRDRHSTSREGKSKTAGRSRDDNDYYTSRRRTDDPSGYTFINDADEQRRRQRRSSYTEPSTSAGMAFDPYSSSYGTGAATGGGAYVPRRASTVVHRGDGSISTGSGSGASGRPKQLRWEDQVRSRRERQNAEIASRAPSFSAADGGGSGVKGILKHTSDGKGKGKGREVEDIEALRRSIERMEIPRGRDRDVRGGGRGDDVWGGGRYGDDYGEGGGRRKRSKVYADDRYRY